LAGNPIVPHIAGENRDPKVIWHEPTKRWIMALYLEGSRYGLFASTDLKDWRQLSTVEIPGTSECPDFFELPLDGDKRHRKWVFWGASAHYLVGSFDGTRFTPETGPIQGYFGNTGYAAQTYFNDPEGRRVQIPWLNGSEFPGCAWNQQMGFPTALTLRTTAAGPRLFFNPVDEIRKLRGVRVPQRNGQFIGESGLYEILASFRVPAAGILTMRLNGHELNFDARDHTLQIEEKRVEIEPEAGKLELHLLVDRASIEVYAQSGRVYVPIYALRKATDNGIAVGTGGAFKTEKLDVFELKSAWFQK
jgi:sucrose-6-phosphate hydrolase SacC (GH32 family)